MNSSFCFSLYHTAFLTKCLGSACSNISCWFAVFFQFSSLFWSSFLYSFTPLNCGHCARAAEFWHRPHFFFYSLLQMLASVECLCVIVWNCWLCQGVLSLHSLTGSFVLCSGGTKWRLVQRGRKVVPRRQLHLQGSCNMKVRPSFLMLNMKASSSTSTTFMISRCFVMEMYGETWTFTTDVLDE